ncbi:MAG: hypothetical protein JXR54_02090, partial [Tannerellaceae bacterium]|nr:hypothetical protein [Tannerellaceae bacterium]
VSSLNQTKTTDYAGHIIYENGSLKRILIEGGYIEGGVYYFYLTDHLGNNPGKHQFPKILRSIILKSL